MSVGELNELMTYVIEGWMLFSAGFTSVAFVSFVARRIQEDEAAIAQANAQLDAQVESVSETEELTVTTAVTQTVASSKPAATPTPKLSKPKPEPSQADPSDEALAEEADEAARLEEVAAVSEKLVREKEKQSSTSAVSVSTRGQ